MQSYCYGKTFISPHYVCTLVNTLPYKCWITKTYTILTLSSLRPSTKFLLTLFHKSMKLSANLVDSCDIAPSNVVVNITFMIDLLGIKPNYLSSTWVSFLSPCSISLSHNFMVWLIILISYNFPILYIYCSYRSKLKVFLINLSNICFDIIILLNFLISHSISLSLRIFHKIKIYI